MKKLSLLLLALLPFSTIQAGEPSAMFGQELAQVSKRNAVNLDLYSARPNNSTLRVGLASGEIIVDPDVGPDGGQSLIYKWFISKKFALYGGLGITDGVTNHTIIGGAYTINTKNVRFNINPVHDANNGTPQNDLYLGAFMKFDGIKNKEMMLGAQLHSDLTASTNNVTVGLRWLARKNVTIDLALYDDTNPNGFLQFPGLISVNMSF